VLLFTAKIAGRDKVVQLIECCDEQLRKDLTRSAGGSLTNKTEQEVLAAIKKLAVREENTMVARVTLHRAVMSAATIAASRSSVT
jgi:hypothetical protein